MVFRNEKGEIIKVFPYGSEEWLRYEQVLEILVEAGQMRKKIKREGKFYAYMVQCTNGMYYIGSTNNLKERLDRHNKGHGAKSLRGKVPVKLVYAKEYRYYKNALHAERNLKKLTRAQKKELVRIYEKQSSL